MLPAAGWQKGEPAVPCLLRSHTRKVPAVPGPVAVAKGGAAVVVTAWPPSESTYADVCVSELGGADAVPVGVTVATLPAPSTVTQALLAEDDARGATAARAAAGPRATSARRPEGCMVVAVRVVVRGAVDAAGSLNLNEEWPNGRHAGGRACRGKDPEAVRERRGEKRAPRSSLRQNMLALYCPKKAQHPHPVVLPSSFPSSNTLNAAHAR